MESADRCMVDGGAAVPDPKSLWHWLKQGLDVDPTAIALEASHVPADHLANLLTRFHVDTHSFAWSYTQLEEASSILAAHLASRGVEQEDAVVTFLPSSVEWAIIFWAAIRLGATFVPLDPQILSRPDELRYLITVANGTVLIADDSQAALLVDMATNTLNAIKIKMMCSLTGPAVQGWDYLGEVTCCGTAVQRLNARGKTPSTASSATIALIMFTSGTTSQPKGCPIPSRAFAASCDGYRAGQLGKWDSNTRFLVTSASFYATCWLGSFTTWRSGGCVVLMPQSSGSRTSVILTAICDTRTTHMFIYPTDLQAMIKDPVLQLHRPRTLRFVNIAGDLVNKTLVNICKRELRVENVVSIWGMTEGAPITNWTSPQDIILFTKPEEGEIAGLGRILPGAKAKVCYRDTHDPLEWGQIGDLHVCANTFIMSYLNGESPETFYKDKSGHTWFITLDRAMICRDGIMYVMGREKDIIRGIETDVIPGISEALLKKQGWAKQCQVIGIPWHDSGEVPVAIVDEASHHTMPSLHVLNSMITSQLESEYALKAVYTLMELGFQDWPRGSTGKILKRMLKEAVVKQRT